MAKIRADQSISLDGYSAGPAQTREEPLGVGGEHLHDWMFPTASWARMYGDGTTGETGVDDDVVVRFQTGVGATIMGRNMFGPIRGPWTEEEWRGWWGEEPPYHHPVFVLTHHARPPLEMQGGTTFHFVEGGIEDALQRALDAADGADVHVAGGAATIQQFLRAGLIDELNVAVAPILLGSGERFFDNLDGGPNGYECVRFVASPRALHVRFERQG